ncbi:MAG TPA: phosphatase PAP2 family protein [Pyrinomonadaceae bacterium]|nr:phosphatase PAP2 family protein [Pyrinomonadaceae bacterium]
MRRNRMARCLFTLTPLALGLSVGVAVHAQTLAPAPAAPAPAAPAGSPTPTLEKEFLKNVLQDQKAIWTAPFHLQGKDAKWLAPSAIGTMALITTDRITGDEMAEFHRQLTPSRIISYGGSFYGAGAVIGTFYLVGRTKNNSRARETGVLSAEASLDGFIVSSALKGVTQRARPLAGVERSEFFDGGNSFPSGHSIQAWSVATIIANEYHEHRVVQVAAYGAAAAIGFSRFTGEKHYLSEVLVGSALGYGIGQYVYHAHHRDIAASGDDAEPLQTSKWPAISPRFSHHTRQYGVALTWNF